MGWAIWLRARKEKIRTLGMGWAIWLRARACVGGPTQRDYLAALAFESDGEDGILALEWETGWLARGASADSLTARIGCYALTLEI